MQLENRVVVKKRDVGILGFMGFCILLIVELIPFRPNILFFNPIWYSAPKEIREIPQQGNWYPGEAMPWGEHNMIAGEKIIKYAEQNNIPIEAIVIFSDYPTDWMNRYGISIQSFSLGKEYYNEDAFYVFSRFMIFRGEIPDFITLVEPIDRIKYKGQTSAWIYKGEQIKDYFN